MNVSDIRKSRYKSCKCIIYFTITVLFIWYVFFLQRDFRKQTTSVSFLEYPADDFSCHFNLKKSNFSENAIDFEPSDYRIFFHETSCKGGLNSRQACAVESAARANPGWNIRVLFLGPIHTLFREGMVYEALQKFKNVNFTSINLTTYSKGTPIELLISQNMSKNFEITETTRPFNIVNLMKYLTLYKFGGVYLELDFIVVNSFSKLSKNWIGKETANKLGVDAMSFSNNKIGRMLANTTMEEIVKNYNPLRRYRGSGILKRALKKICSTNNVENMTAVNCQGLELYEQYYFYPLINDNVIKYFSESALTLLDTYSAYAHRIWSEVPVSEIVPNNTRLFKLARSYCPTVLKIYENYFGM